MHLININLFFNNLSKTIQKMITTSIEPEPIYPKMVLINNEYEFIQTINKIKTNNDLDNQISINFTKPFFCPKNGFSNILPINQLNAIKNNINNYKSLNTNELKFIETCSEQDKMDIIHLMNKHIHYKRPKIKEID